MQGSGLVEGAIALHGEGNRLQGIQARQQRGGLVGLQGEQGTSQAVDFHGRLKKCFIREGFHAILHPCLASAQRHEIYLPGGRIVVVEIALGHLQLDTVLALHAEHGVVEAVESLCRVKRVRVGQRNLGHVAV